MHFQSLHKYKANKVSHAGRSFASKLEASLYDYLKLLELAGDISELTCQVTVYLTRARIQMRPDDSVLEHGKLIFAEAKGYETSDYRIKRKLWQFYGPGPLRVYKGTYRKLVLAEELIPESVSE